MADVRELTHEVTRLAREAGYVVIGFGVLGLQQANVRRRELAERLSTGDLEATVAGLRQQLADRTATVDVEATWAELTRRAQQIDELVEQLIEVVETSLAPLEEQLPAPARDAAARAHDQARVVRSKVRERITPPAA
jgi:hypothetical protein